MPKIKMQG